MRREPVPRRAEQLGGVAAERAVAADPVERRPVAGRAPQHAVLGVTQARCVQLGGQRRRGGRGRLDPQGHGGRRRRLGGLGAAVGPFRGVAVEHAGAARVGQVPDHQPRPGRPQQRLGDRVREAVVRR